MAFFYKETYLMESEEKWKDRKWSFESLFAHCELPTVTMLWHKKFAKSLKPDGLIVKSVPGFGIGFWSYWFLFTQKGSHRSNLQVLNEYFLSLDAFKTLFGHYFTFSNKLFSSTLITELLWRKQQIFRKFHFHRKCTTSNDIWLFYLAG